LIDVIVVFFIGRMPSTSANSDVFDLFIPGHQTRGQLMTVWLLMLRRLFPVSIIGVETICAGRGIS
jgi:hypothetical protein